jgi:MFS family permease
MSDTTSTSHVRRVGLASGIGTAIERYDVFFCGTAAAVVFGPQFFPQVSELSGRLAAFATFAIGFVALPLGAIVMGHFGDRQGRKSMLVWSLILMGASTFRIGLLPTYAQIGISAPLLLVALRFIQGFARGGEWGGATLLSVEHAPSERRGLYGSFMALGLPVGVIRANLVFLVTSAAFSRKQFVDWAWRLPFLASAGLMVFGLLSTRRHEVRATRLARAVRDDGVARPVYRFAASGVFRAVPRRCPLQRRIAEPYHRDHRGRRASAHHCDDAVRPNRQLAVDYRLSRDALADLLAVRSRAQGNVSTSALA